MSDAGFQATGIWLTRCGAFCPSRKGRKTTENAWKVSAADIAARNYNLDCKNPHAVEVNHRDPVELMAEYQEISGQLAEAQSALLSELMLALGRE